MTTFIEGPYLHYTTRAKTKMCYCAHAKRHERWYPVIDEYPELEHSVRAWMQQRGVTTCTQDEWEESGMQREVKWRARSEKDQRRVIHTGKDKRKTGKDEKIEGLSPFQRWMVGGLVGGPVRGKQKGDARNVGATKKGGKEKKEPQGRNEGNMEDWGSVHCLHYVGDRSVVCRCEDLNGHGTTWAELVQDASIVQAAYRVFSAAENKEKLMCKEEEWAALIRPGKGKEKADMSAQWHADATITGEFASLYHDMGKKPRELRFHDEITQDSPRQSSKSAQRPAKKAQGSHKTSPPTSESTTPPPPATLPTAMSSITEQIDDLQQSISQASFNPRDKRNKPPSPKTTPPEPKQPTLPSQTTFLTTGITPTKSSTHPPPSTTCPFCRAPFSLRRKTHQTILLPACGHYTHLECLTDHFRSRDAEIGTCPACDMALCRRSRSEALDMEREAIFGVTGFTSMDEVVDVGVPLDEVVVDGERMGGTRRETVLCASEEEIAVCQLRVLKDETARGLGRELGKGDVDWVGIVAGVLKGFREKGFPLEKVCRFIISDEAFLRFVVWAELVRRVGSEMVVDGEGLKGLSRRELGRLKGEFQQAKMKLDEEMMRWRERGEREVDCNFVVKDAYAIAMKTMAAARK